MTPVTGEGTEPSLHDELAAALGLGTVPEDTDLFELGLDSLTVIRLATRWRRHGVEVTFEDLADQPTLRAWSRLLGGGDAAAPAFDLSPMQRAYHVGRADGQPYGGVAAHFFVELDGAGLDPVRLQTAYERLVAHHPMLRCRTGDDGRAVIGAVTGLPAVTVDDLRDRTPGEREDRLARTRERLGNRRGDLERAEVIELVLSLLPDGACRLHVDVDMIAADASSFALLLDDLAAFYDDRAPSAPAMTFPEFLAARDRADGLLRASDARWWADRLDDLPGTPELPLREGPAPQPRTVRLHHRLGPAARTALAAAAHARGLTLASVSAAALAEVVAAWSGGGRHLLNVPVFDRELPDGDATGVAGNFTGSVLVATGDGPGSTFAENARETQRRTHAAVGHAAYGGVEVLRELTRRSGAPVLAPVVHTSALGLGDLVSPAARERLGAPVWVATQNPQVWIDAQVREDDGGLLLNWNARADVLAPGVPEAMFAAYRDLIGDLAAGAGRWDEPVGSLVPGEQRAARRRAEETALVPVVEGLHEAVFRHAAADGERTAIAGAMTYGELAGAALRVAAALGARGVRPGDPVVITLPRGPRQVVAVLGVLAAGGCYVPVGLDQPPARRERILGRLADPVVLTEAELDAALAAEPLAAPVAVDPGQAAYLLFTSGSTGVPKGVEVSHAAAVNTVESVNARFGVGPDDRTLLVSALDFDLSVYELFGPLRAGGAVVPLSPGEERDAERWLRLVRDHAVTVWNSVPVLYDMLLTVAADLPLRLVLLCGDWVTPDLAARTRAQAPGCRFVALAGMTEAAIHSTMYEVGEVDPAWRSVPIGAPLDHQRCRVVDARGRDCPDWVPGELWVGGAGVALGYRGDPERTAERFTAYDGCRWYRTGDIARYRDGAVLEFLGRADHQVKVRGHRIELGEIESVIEEHPAVWRAVATVVDGPVRRLAAGVAGDVTAEELRTWQRERLPPHMVCERIRILPELPLSANGKLDRTAVARALAPPGRHEGNTGPAGAESGTGSDDRTDRGGEHLAGRAADRGTEGEARRGAGRGAEGEARRGAAGEAGGLADGVAPLGEVEGRLAALWGRMLGVDAVRREDTFFGLGGDSLAATRMIGELPAAGLGGGRLGALFGAPSLEDFAATLYAAGNDAAPCTVTADPAARHDPFPATEVQTAYRIGRDPRFTLGGVGTWQYHEFDGTGVDLGRLERAWNRLVDRHEMLRAVFDEDGRQRILAEVPRTRIAVEDVTDGPAGPALDRLREQASHRVLSLRGWPLFDLRAVRYADPDRAGEVRTRLAVGLDYAAFDALSIMTLFTELDRLYTDPDAALPEIGVSFRDYCLQVHPEPEAVDAARRHWTRRLADLPAPPRLPLRTDPAAIGVPRFTRRSFRLDPEAWTTLRARARAHGLTPSSVLLAAYAEVLGRWSTEPDVTLALTLFDRRAVHPHIDRVLGDFTSLALIGHHPGASWLTAATATHRRLGADLDHRDVPLTWLWREFARRTGAIDTPAPVVFTSAIGVAGRDTGISLDTSPSFPERCFGLSQTPQTLLDNQVSESRGGLLVTWDAVEEAFDDGVLDAMSGAYRTLLDHLAAPGTDWADPLPDLLPPAQRAVRDAVSGTARPLPADTLHGPFFDAAPGRAGRPAVIADGATTTHGELAGRALRMAAGLQAAGVRPGDTVAVALPKGRDQIAAVLAVLAAGAAYVPIAYDAPARRRARILDIAAPRLVVDAVEPFLAEEPARPVAVDPHDLAYVIFTSGSTGEPKGVEVEHASAANTVADVAERIGLGPGDRVLAVSALDFDLSVFDVFGLLGAGGALVLPAEEERRRADRWHALARAHDVTVWNSVPMLLEMLLAAGHGELPPSLRTALVSGDWVPLDLPGQVRKGGRGRCRLLALGGATEASIWSNVLEVDEAGAGWTSVPYGFPLSNQRYRVADPLGRDRPDGVPGELWIGGAGVARGYRGAPGPTAERFVTHDGGRWYRTGDQGRYWPDGTLEFLGRLDDQVKVRGHRLEPGEVEAALGEHPEVAHAVVVAVGDRHDRSLHAFLTGPPAEPADLAAHLAERLPAHAVPERITVLGDLPLTANGKVDRAALTDRARRDRTGTGAGAAGAWAVETELAALWAEILGLAEPPERSGNFFALGGTSLLALRLAADMHARFGREVGLREVFLHPTLGELAALVGPDDASEEVGEL